MSILEFGEEYVHIGLANEPLSANYERHVILMGISTHGDVQFRLEIIEGGETTSKSIGSVPLSAAHMMIEEGIWVTPEHYAEKKRSGALRFT